MKKRILITGAAGFIGAHVVQYVLENTDWDIVCLDRFDTSGNINRLAEVIPESHKTRVKIVYHDLKASINEATAKMIGGKVHYVVHLAASSHVDRSIADPLSFIMDNVVGTTNLLIWAQQGGMYQGRLLHDPRPSGSPGFPDDIQEPEGRFINFSTDEVFGPAPEGYAHKENDPHYPSNPYSASKSGQEAIGYAFWITKQLPVITTHTMNNFGERQHPEKLVPATIRSVINQTPMPIFAELNDDGVLQGVGSRYWMHCKNTASAIVFLLEKGTPGEAYNVIGFDELTNLEIAEKVAAIIGKPLIPKFVDFHKVRPGHDRRYALDGSKMRDMGWVPVVDFDTSLRQMVEFTIANPQWQ